METKEDAYMLAQWVEELSPNQIEDFLEYLEDEGYLSANGKKLRKIFWEVFVCDKTKERTIFRYNGRTYYRTRLEVMERRRNGDRIYYCPKQLAYYLVRPIKKSFWGF